jgi:DNA-directed RNA polymerase III subunit RPC8
VPHGRFKTCTAKITIITPFVLDQQKTKTVAQPKQQNTMFEVDRIADLIQLEACDLGLPTADVLARTIDERYANRVVLGQQQGAVGGLVICRYDAAHQEPTVIVSAGGICQEGKTYWTIEFSVIVFRPFIGEILVGTIAEANSGGLRVTLGHFFGAIYIPAYWMLRPSVYDAACRTWVWQSDDESYEMPVGAEIRIRVKSVHYTKRSAVTAKGAGQQVEDETTTISGRKRSSSLVDPSSSDHDVSSIGGGAAATSAMYITASICEDGLGLTEWWTNAGGPDDDNDDDGEQEVAEEDEEAHGDDEILQTKEEEQQEKTDIDGADWKEDSGDTAQVVAMEGS